MARDQNSLWHLASSVEEILDVQLADARSRSKYRRETQEKLDDILAFLKKRPETPSDAEGLHLSPKTLKDLILGALKWLIPLLAGGGITHAIHLMK